MITRIRRYRLDNVQAQPAKALLIDGRTASTKRLSIRLRFGSSLHSGQDTARGELKWQNIDADDLPAEVKKSFDAMVEAEATFKANLEKLLKNEGHMPEDKSLVMSRKGKRLGVAFVSTPRGEGGAGFLKFKTK